VLQHRGPRHLVDRTGSTEARTSVPKSSHASPRVGNVTFLSTSATNSRKTSAALARNSYSSSQGQAMLPGGVIHQRRVPLAIGPGVGGRCTIDASRPHIHHRQDSRPTTLMPSRPTSHSRLPLIQPGLSRTIAHKNNRFVAPGVVIACMMSGSVASSAVGGRYHMPISRKCCRPSEEARRPRGVRHCARRLSSKT